MPFEFDRELIERLEHAVYNLDSSFVASVFEGLHPEDVATILYEFEAPEARYILDCLDRDRAAIALTFLDSETRKRFIKTFRPRELAVYIPHMHSDDAADILNEQPVDFKEKVLSHISQGDMRQALQELIQYPSDAAGGLMEKEYVKARTNWTLAQTIEEIRRQAKNVDKVLAIYVVDGKENLKGFVTLKHVILADQELTIKEIYNPDVIYVDTSETAENVASIMQRYDIEALPVVNAKGRLVGRITIDDIIDVITEQAEYERQIMSGISEDVEEHDSVWKLTRSRLPWLLIGMMGGMAGAQFLGLFERDLAMIPAMAFFIPLITATGGNVGIQSSTAVVQSLAGKQSITKNLWRQFFKTLLVAILNGIALSLFVFGINLIFGQDLTLSVVVSLALFSVVLLASLMGTATPLALNKMGINPAMASGPFITTANDLLGLSVYFGVAHLLFSFA